MDLQNLSDYSQPRLQFYLLGLRNSVDLVIPLHKVAGIDLKNRLQDIVLMWYYLLVHQHPSLEYVDALYLRLLHWPLILDKPIEFRAEFYYQLLIFLGQDQEIE